MNGVHDMGGMHGMGPVQPEKNEPVFHARWEGRVFAVDRLVRGKWNAGASRYQKEQLPPAEYFRISYFERVLVGLTGLLIKHGLVTRAEIETGRPARGSTKGTPLVPAASVPALVANGVSSRRSAPVAPRFAVGQRVRARNINPPTHTRLPRYARGRAGTVDRDHGVFVFPDTSAEGLGEKPQHVYAVRFAARELWGDVAAPNDSVVVDMWDDYLEPLGR